MLFWRKLLFLNLLYLSFDFQKGLPDENLLTGQQYECRKIYFCCLVK